MDGIQWPSIALETIEVIRLLLQLPTSSPLKLSPKAHFSGGLFLFEPYRREPCH